VKTSPKILLPVLFIGLLWSLATLAQNDEVKADITISVQQDQEIWAGQQVTINLDLKTTGFSFSNTHFNLPEVGGAFLMQTDTTTIKLTEKVDGQSWQIVRYPLALYPQKAGHLEIPPIDVRFSSSAGFGNTEKTFEFQSRPLELTIAAPPGVEKGDLVITTGSFELEYDWQPQTAAAKTGDAFTLTVSRRADDISAMLLPPLPVFRTEGLAVYPQTPEVKDKTDRGDLSGERTDTIIWVVEKPGTYDIPGIRFQWWDPAGRELKQQIVPGIKLDIPLPPADKADQITAEKSKQVSYNPWQILALILAVCLVISLWLRYGTRPGRKDLDNEKQAFTRLQKSCRTNHPGQTHSAVHAWLRYFPGTQVINSRPLTLGEFARIYGDKQLATELKNLQLALITSNHKWQGAVLFSSLQNFRRKTRQQKVVQSKNHLAPLNP